MSNAIDLQYPAILAHIRKHTAEGRTESRAFLAWFLETYYRLEEIDAQDAVCDGIDDRGIDGLYVDDNLEQVDVFQAKLLRTPNRTLGDTQLKEFYGSVSQFRDPDNVVRIANSTGNVELRNLILGSKASKKIRDGYSVKGVFVTNATRDGNAEEYLHGCPDLALYDAISLEEAFVSADPSSPMRRPVTLDLYGTDLIEYRVSDVVALFAPISATELIQLDGLASGELFVWNVRRSLGRTKVNKSIAQSVRNVGEHSNFLLYHNGITILCADWARDGDKLTISNYAVVNGAQSLTSLYQNREHITDDLQILTRVIRLPPDSDLASKITYHSNNQNSISARDLQSTSSIQRRLQNEFRRVYPDQVFYKIQRGEESQLPSVIENDDAARIMLAFDLEQPWTCHQTYKLFDELHSDVFARPEVDAHRIYALFEVYNGVLQSLEQVRNEMLGRYRLTRYFMLYLLRRVLNMDRLGKRFVQSPARFLSEPQGAKRIRDSVESVLGDLIIDFNAEIEERECQGQPFDYKREFKSPNPVRDLAKSIIAPYQKAIRRNRATSFALEWETSATP